MPRLEITNTSNQRISRANKVFPPKETKTTFIRDSKMSIIDACKSLEWDYANPLLKIDFGNIEDYTAVQLRRFGQEVGVKNYSKINKADMIEALTAKAVEDGIIEGEGEEEEEEQEEQGQKEQEEPQTEDEEVDSNEDNS